MGYTSSAAEADALCSLNDRRQARQLLKCPLWVPQYAGMEFSASLLLLTVGLLINAGSSSNGSPTREPAAAPAAEGPASSSALGNDRMAWELLYDLRWRLPTEELDLAWSDALGTTSVMQVGGGLQSRVWWCCRGCQEWGSTSCANCTCAGSLLGLQHLRMS